MPKERRNVPLYFAKFLFEGLPLLQIIAIQIGTVQRPLRPEGS